MTNNLWLLCIMFSCLLISCTKEVIKESYGDDYQRWVGDIAYNADFDDVDFKICNGEERVAQYFHHSDGPLYPGEKPEVIRTIKTQFKPLAGKNQNGYVRVRFIVNCEGKAGRFRIIQSDLDFKKTKFDFKIINQLTEITEGIEKWVVIKDSEALPVDYYFYLIFKIVDGDIAEILP